MNTITKIDLMEIRALTATWMDHITESESDRQLIRFTGQRKNHLLIKLDNMIKFFSEFSGPEIYEIKISVDSMLRKMAMDTPGKKEYINQRRKELIEKLENLILKTK